MIIIFCLSLRTGNLPPDDILKPGAIQAEEIPDHGSTWVKKRNCPSQFPLSLRNGFQSLEKFTFFPSNTRRFPLFFQLLSQSQLFQQDTPLQGPKSSQITEAPERAEVPKRRQGEMSASEDKGVDCVFSVVVGLRSLHFCFHFCDFTGFVRVVA